ncbi:MAG: hypothetical protein WD795_00650 [Woeseia sp.]
MNDIRPTLSRDAEAVPLDLFIPLSATVREYGAPRLGALAELLEEHPQERGWTQLYLAEFMRTSMRQVGATQSLHTTFVQRAEDVEESTLQAMPEHTRTAWTHLIERAKANPIPVTDPTLFAHGLAIDGELCRYLSGEPEKPKETPEQVFRRLATKHHPDKGGSPEVMAAVNEMRKAMR